ncbi:hypothetical protein A2U01_0069128, partial [Trifolium medium]|nr:hypothetical protein [Trifolium medium]
DQSNLRARIRSNRFPSPRESGLLRRKRVDSLPPSQKVAISGDPGHSNGEAAPEP